MTEFAAPSPGRIFISYRREETAYPAGWLFDRLAKHFGGGQVFKDVDSIELGDDFVEVITAAVGSCDVLLALIGDQWLTITDAHGRRRLDNPDDFVRLEIEAALARGVRVIPILVGGARMPRAEELPENLAKLVRRQALELSPSRFNFDTSRLLRVLDKTLAERRKAEHDADQAGMPTVKRADPNTRELPKTPVRHKETRRSPKPDVPPVVVDRLAGPSPSAQDKRSDKQRLRLHARPRVLLGVGAAVMLILLLVVAIIANSGTSPSTMGVVFQDDFSGRAAGWDDAGNKRVGGHYTNGAYRIYAAPVPGGGSKQSFPWRASGVYPSAPQNLRIEVAARRLPGSGDQDTGYGIICRNSQNAGGYEFTLGGDYVNIAKYSNTNSDWVELATGGIPAIDINATNRLEAVCSSEGQQAVRLVFSVNGKKVAEATDTKNPFSTGTVGLFAGTGSDSKTAVEAEFDNFVITRV
jgi:hypothetical protein